MGNYVKYKDSELIYQDKQSIVEANYDELAPGIYEPHNVAPPFMSPQYAYGTAAVMDNLVNFSSGIIAEVVSDSERFFSEKTVRIYKEMGIGHKMGVIMYGPVGTGKTSAAFLIMHTLCEKYKAICLDFTSYKLGFILNVINSIRKHQTNPIVGFVDEAEKCLKQEEQSYLTFLDGTDSVSNFIYLGCTNKLDQIPERIAKRRSRIKHLYCIDSLPDAVYREYLRDKIPDIKKPEEDKFVYLAGEHKLTIDELKHAVIDYRVDDEDIEVAIKKVKSYQ